MLSTVYRKVRSDVHDKLMEDGGYEMAKRGDNFFRGFERFVDSLLSPRAIAIDTFLASWGITCATKNPYPAPLGFITGLMILGEQNDSKIYSAFSRRVNGL